jgi:hypothetical protein
MKIKEIACPSRFLRTGTEESKGLLITELGFQRNNCDS